MSFASVAGCSGKKRFDRFALASAAATRRNRHDKAHLQPYRCKHCAGFHVGESLNYGKPKRKDHAAPT